MKGRLRNNLLTLANILKACLDRAQGKMANSIDLSANKSIDKKPDKTLDTSTITTSF